MLPHSFIKYFVAVTAEDLAIAVFLPIFELAFVDSIISVGEHFTVARFLAVDPVSFVKITSSVSVNPVALSLIVFEITLVIAHFVCESTLTVHESISPVAFKYGRSIFDKCKAESITFTFCVPLAFVVVSILQSGHCDELSLAKL